MATTILVVDDSDAIREVTAAMLRGSGFAVTEAGTGTDALRLAGTRPDLIVLDVHLPDIDGLEVCRRLKANPDTAAIPVLHLSGTFRAVEDRVRGLEIGADAYLTKPVGLAELVATIRALLRLRQAETGLRVSEVRRRAAETLVEIGRLLARSLDPQVIEQRIIDSVGGLLNAPAAALFRLERESGDLVALAVSGDVSPAWGPHLVIPSGAGLAGVALRERRPVVTPDLLTDTRVRLTPEARTRIQASGYRATLAVPLMIEDRALGALVVRDRAGRVFDQEEIRVAQAFADQAILALENARLYSELARQKQEAEELARVARIVTESLDVEAVGHRIVESVLSLFPALDVVLWRLAPDGSLVSVARSGSAARYFDPHAVLPPGIGLAGRAVTARQPTWTRDVLADPTLTLPGDLRTRLARSGLRAILSVPLTVKGEIIGALSVADQTARTFSDAEVVLLQTFAHQAALALQNARLFEAGQRELAERRRAEEALRESQETLRAVIDAVPAMIAAKDLRSRYIFMNRFQARLYGSSESEAVGRTAAEILGRDYGTYTETLDRQVIESGQALPYFEERYADARGIMHDWLTTKVPLLDTDGRVRGVATVAVDITEHKRLEEQLRQAQKMGSVGRLAGGIAHDFNNLLTVITGRSQILLAQLGADNPLRRHLSLIENTAERAAALTRQLLAFSRKQMLQPKVIDLNVVVAGMEKILRRLIGENIELITVPAPGLGRVKADPGQVEQVIMNLAVNARDAMPHGGRLTLETCNVELDPAVVERHPECAAGPYARLTVADTGIGMDAATQAHLFEPFFTTKELGKGTGLGLATVYGIVKQHGGALTVESVPGQGAVFRIYLPQVAEAPEAVDPAPGPSTPPRGAETVLLVEDEDDVRDLAHELLELAGYRVLEARHPDEALLVADHETGTIHLLVTDVVLPQISGRELADRLTTRRPGLRVLYMSGYTDDAIVHHGVLDPGVALIQKPFSPDALARRVREVLDATDHTMPPIATAPP